jgi:hypothetical protein
MFHICLIQKYQQTGSCKALEWVQLTPSRFAHCGWGRHPYLFKKQTREFLSTIVNPESIGGIHNPD